MRVMEIPPFPHRMEIRNLEYFMRERLSQKVVMWPAQAIALVGYMCWPNDPTARSEAVAMLERWSHDPVPSVPPRLHRIQHEWLRVADIFNVYSDLVAGEYQVRRGGPSLGKAVTLVAANAKSRGTGEANLWCCWKAYKDVAHLVTGAAVVCAHARIRGREEAFGLSQEQYLPFQMVMLMPDLVLGVAQEFQRLGLSGDSDEIARPTSDPEQKLDVSSNPSDGSAGPADAEQKLDPETLWRIPSDINVVPFPVPIRKIRPEDRVILNERRAGNRGRANRHETTPVLD